MTDRRTFLRNISLLTLGGIASGCDILGNRREKDGVANLFARTGVTARYA